MPTDEIGYVLDQICLILQKVKANIGMLWKIVPSPFRMLVEIVSVTACVGIVIFFIKAVIGNKASWKKRHNLNLMFSYAAGSGQTQRRCIFKDAYKSLFDKKSTIFSLVGLAYRIGSYETSSKMIAFLASFIYLPLTILGTAEMIIRCSVGATVYFFIDLAYTVFLIFLWMINIVLMPFFKLVDKAFWKVQHCPNCYTTFKLPVFECPNCGAKHSMLYPGKSGLLFAKCTCGHFVPCSSASTRKELKSYCPKCNHALAGSNVKALTIQVIGADSSGKTAFIAAFHHQYVEATKSTGVSNILTFPEESFKELERMYVTGKTEKSPSDEVIAYSIIHRSKRRSDDGIVIYDVPDEILLSEQYKKSPINFAYSDGIIVLLDPLSVRTVKEQCETLIGTNNIGRYSNDSADDIVVHFLKKYSEVTGRLAKRMSKVPVAIVITKTDLIPVNEEIGDRFTTNDKRLGRTDEIRNAVCRSYLSEIGLGNVVNNIDSVFSEVSLFAISSIGHSDNENGSFKPCGVVEPIDWIAKERKSAIHKFTTKIKETSL